MSTKELEFYHKREPLMETIEQILALDIRSVHQGRGHDSVSKMFNFRIDNIQVYFQTLRSNVEVVSCEYISG